MKSDTISVIIPAYNEEETILKNLKKLEDVLESFSKQHALNYEVIIVDDGSDDNTYAEVTKYKKLNRKIKLISYIKNGGKGNALKAGFAHVSGNYIAFLDADLDISPDHIPTFYRYMMEKDADVVIGSKHHPESNINYPRSRKILSRVYQLMNFGLFRLKLSDTQSGFKMFKYEVLRDIFPNILCKKYAFDLELLVNTNHWNWVIVEHPITIDWKRSENRMSLKDIWQIALDTAAIFYRLRIIKHYDGPYKIILPKIHKVYNTLYYGIGK